MIINKPGAAIICALFLICIPVRPLFAQNKGANDEPRKILVYRADTIVETFIAHEKLDETEPLLFYYWYLNQSIQSNQGGYSGYLLDGPYKLSVNRGTVLIEQGAFKKGLKEGVWSLWNTDGTLRSSGEWDGGLLDGEYREYTNGKLSLESDYRSGLLHGESIKYNLADGTQTVVKYSNGVIVPAKVPKQKKQPKTEPENSDAVAPNAAVDGIDTTEPADSSAHKKGFFSRLKFKKKE